MAKAKTAAVTNNNIQVDMYGIPFTVGYVRDEQIAFDPSENLRTMVEFSANAWDAEELLQKIRPTKGRAATNPKVEKLSDGSFKILAGNRRYGARGLGRTEAGIALTDTSEANKYWTGAECDIYTSLTDLQRETLRADHGVTELQLTPAGYLNTVQRLKAVGIADKEIIVLTRGTLSDLYGDKNTGKPSDHEDVLTQYRGTVQTFGGACKNKEIFDLLMHKLTENTAFPTMKQVKALISAHLADAKANPLVGYSTSLTEPALTPNLRSKLDEMKAEEASAAPKAERTATGITPDKFKQFAPATACGTAVKAFVMGQTASTGFFMTVLEPIFADLERGTGFLPKHKEAIRAGLKAAKTEAPKVEAPKPAKVTAAK